MAGPLPRFLALYVVLFAAFGVASPFVPAVLASEGLGPSAIGAVLAAGTGIRLLAGPAGGRLADRVGREWVLSGLLAAAGALALGYLPARGLAALLGISVLHASALAPVVPIADALTVRQAEGGAARFRYGSVRGAGSAAYVGGVNFSGIAVGWAGLPVIFPLQAALFAAAAFTVLGLPRAPPAPTSERPSSERPFSQHPAAGGAASLLRLPGFVRLMLVAALVQGSHALHDGFAVIRWEAAGIGPGAAGLLWSEAVAAEVLVFAGIGPALLDRIGAANAAILAAAAGVLRWGVMACTASLPAMALIEPLHGLTYALLHLACMRLLARMAPPHLAATAQAFYGTVAVGAMAALLMLLSGPLYGWWGARAFIVMAALCAAALPLAAGLRPPPPRPGRARGCGGKGKP